MQLASFAVALLLGLVGLRGDEVPASASEPDEDVLGEIEVEALETDPRGVRRMRVALPPVEGAGAPHRLVESVLRRDLELTGQFELLDLDGTEVPPSAEALLRVSVEPGQPGETTLVARVFFDPDAVAPAFEKRIQTPYSELRWGTHRLVDEAMAALTGYRGPFASRLAFVARRGDTRSAYVVDADGHGLKRVTGPDKFVATVAYGADGRLYYSASINHGRLRLYREGRDEPLDLEPRGSIYGIAFSDDGTRAALTIAVGSDVRLFAGPADLSRLKPSGALSLALSPAFSPSGRLAVAGTDSVRPRIWVEGRPASPRGASASSPSYCASPEGTKLVYALGSRRRSAVVVAREDGRNPRRITSGSARNSHPACSPDGRLVAFFSSRRSTGGPGLYLLRVDGRKARKIATIRGDSLHWSPRLDPGR